MNIDDSDEVECGFLSQIGNTYSQNQTLSKGLTLLTSKVENTLQSSNRAIVLG